MTGTRFAMPDTAAHAPLRALLAAVAGALAAWSL
jgi:hypothetical protein